MRVTTRQLAASLTSALLITLLLARQIGESEIDNDLYQTIEWRIFYPGHFIRRGLRGSILDWLSHVTAVPPDTLIRWTCTVASALLAIAFTTYLFRWLWGEARSWIPILLLSPAGLFFYQDAILSIERFDVFFLLLTVCHLELCVRSKDEKSYTVLAATLFSTLGVVAVLCHEAFLLLCMPVNIILTSWRLGRWNARMLQIYGPVTVAGCFCVFSHVTAADIVTLSHTLGVPIGSPEWYTGPLFLLAVSPTRQFAVVWTLLTADAIRPFLFTALIFGTVHFAALRRVVPPSTSEEGWVRPKLWWRDLLLIPFLCTVPMYVVAADYGRWFVMVVATFTICCARLLQVRTPVKRAPRFITSLALVIFVFVPMPLSLRFPGSGPQLLTWSGAAILGHFYAGPPRRLQLEGRAAPQLNRLSP